MGGSYNGFYNASSFGSHPITTATPPFETIGYGHFYLTNGIAFRNLGTNGIDSDLRSSLQQKTTYAPVLHLTESINSDTTYSPTVLRDMSLTNVDLGYHYDPIDHLFAQCDAYANITFAPGTAVAWYRTTTGWYHAGYGIHLDDQKIATFAGSYEQPCYWVRGNTVQEGSAGQPLSYGYGGMTGWADQYLQDPTLSPEVHLSFTRCSEMAGEETAYFADDYGYLKVRANHCELYSGYIGNYGISFAMTNCLFDHAGIANVEGWTGNFLYLRNCTFHRGGLALTPSSEQPDILVEDCAFDTTNISQSDLGFNGTFDYNAYLSGAYNLTTNTTGTPSALHDLTIAFVWEKGMAGNFYIPTNSTLVDSGSRSAAAAGLYQFTTATNQTKEAGTTVDRGYHYVALDNSGNPQDSNDDGVPDYVADANGNGTEDTGETPWARPYIITQPAAFTGSAGATATFTVIAKGTPTLTYQWQKNGSNIGNGANVSGATSTALTISSIADADSANYSVKVSNSYGNATSSSAPLVITPSWVGPVTHTWTPMLGGGIWYQDTNVIMGIVDALRTNYPQPVLVGLRSDRAEQGYRFDQDQFAIQFYDWTPASHEFVITNLMQSTNVTFMWSIPMPTNPCGQPYYVFPTNLVFGSGSATNYTVSLILNREYYFTRVTNDTRSSVSWTEAPHRLETSRISRPIRR
jgi:hypothetical protein